MRLPINRTVPACKKLETVISESGGRVNESPDVIMMWSRRYFRSSVAMSRRVVMFDSRLSGSERSHIVLERSVGKSDGG